MLQSVRDSQDLELGTAADEAWQWRFAGSSVDETFTRAHIHKAASTANGGIHWDFLEAGDPVASLGGQPAILRGTARARTVASVDDLLANPDLYHVNVHSTDFPGGSLRGQLR